MSAMVSCDKVPINGDLDGMWQVMTIQTPQGVRNMKAERAYLSVQLKLCQWDNAKRRYYSHFEHQGDSLFFYDFAYISLHRTKDDDNEWMTEYDMVKKKIMDVWGIHNLNARYRVIELNGDNLTLQSADTIISFRKF